MIEHLRYLILKFSLPVTKLLGRLHAPWTRKKLSGLDLEHIQSIIKPGDTLLSRTRGEFSNLFQSGFWTHSAIYFGTDKQLIIEAVNKGVQIVNLAEFVLKKDFVAICRPMFLSEDEARNASSVALTMVGQPYDFYFMPSNEAWYCSELVAYAYKLANKGQVEFTKRKTLGVLTVIPSDFWRARKKFDIVWASINKQKDLK